MKNGIFLESENRGVFGCVKMSCFWRFRGRRPKSGVVKKIGPTRVCLRNFGALFKNRNIS